MLERITKFVIFLFSLEAGRNENTDSVQLHGTSRNAPANGRYRRPAGEIRFGDQILPEWLAHQTPVSTTHGDLMTLH